MWLARTCERPIASCMPSGHIIGETKWKADKMTTTSQGQPYEFEVDGQKLDSETPVMRASEILEEASRQDPTLGNPGDLTLRDADNNHKYQATEEVDLREAHAFITLPDDSTPVA